MIWLSREQVIYLHSELIKCTGGLDGVRDEGSLQSALVAPMQTYDSKELFPSVIDKASRLACGLTQFHPFIDGNKRTGAHVMLVVLMLNGITLSYTQQELSLVFLQLAAGEIEYEELRNWVRAHVQSIVQ